MNETHLMPEASETKDMKWSTAVQVIDWCVANAGQDSRMARRLWSGQADEVMEAWERILRG